MGKGVALRRPIGAPQALPAAEAVFAVDMFGRDFGDEAAGEAAHPLAVDAAVGGVIDARALPRPRDRDIGEAAFLLQAGGAALVHRARSEEHTSELQSLMRISYAVFCLKKKKITSNQETYMN